MISRIGGGIIDGIFTLFKKRVAKFVAKSVDAEEQMNYIRHYDSLTGLPNRKILIDTFNSAPNLSEKAILVINIGRLHSINELYGRDVGDQVIIQLSKRLKHFFGAKKAIFR